MFALLAATSSYVASSSTGGLFSWGSVFTRHLEDAWVWALLTPPLFDLARSFSFARRNWRQPLLVHLPGAVVFAFAGALASADLYAIIPWGHGPGVPAFHAHLVSLWLGNIPRYCVIVAMSQAITYYGKYRERELGSLQLEAQLAHAQLQSLKMQLEPHFLFNVLNSIASLARQNPAAAEEMTVDLADLLRASLDTMDLQETALWRELEFLQRYLRIQQSRFQRRLRVDFEIQPGAGAAAVPHLILQPLVENAIKHGVGARSGRAQIRVHARASGDRLVLEVRDNGRGLPEAELRHEGIGLSNTRMRLQKLYGQQCQFTLSSMREGGCCATVVMPFREIPDLGCAYESAHHDRGRRAAGARTDQVSA